MFLLDAFWNFGHKNIIYAGQNIYIPSTLAVVMQYATITLDITIYTFRIGTFWVEFYFLFFKVMFYISTHFIFHKKHRIR